MSILKSYIDKLKRTNRIGKLIKLMNDNRFEWSVDTYEHIPYNSCWNYNIRILEYMLEHFHYITYPIHDIYMKLYCGMYNNFDNLNDYKLHINYHNGKTKTTIPLSVRDPAILKYVMSREILCKYDISFMNILNSKFKIDKMYIRKMIMYCEHTKFNERYMKLQIIKNCIY